MALEQLQSYRGWTSLILIEPTWSNWCWKLRGKKRDPPCCDVRDVSCPQEVGKIRKTCHVKRDPLHLSVWNQIMNRVGTFRISLQASTLVSWKFSPEICSCDQYSLWKLLYTLERKEEEHYQCMPVNTVPYKCHNEIFNLQTLRADFLNVVYFWTKSNLYSWDHQQLDRQWPTEG